MIEIDFDRMVIVIIFVHNYTMCQETALSNTTYDLLHAMGKDAGLSL
jgi:hypothetical protein